MENKIKGWVFLFVSVIILTALTGCGAKRTPPLPEKSPLPEEKVETGKPVVKPAKPSQPLPPVQAAPPAPSAPAKTDPRMLAAANLVEQGKTYLTNGKPDQAIETFERALSIDPSNGKTYYFMAEAWIMKKNKNQAAEFNRLAGMYLSEDSQWSEKTTDQKRRIQSMP